MSEQAVIVSKVPVADPGGPESLDLIQGRVVRVATGQRIVLYANSFGIWYLQPASSRPFTEIKPDLTWESMIHLGDRYAALLVAGNFTPPNKMQDLPPKGGPVLAISTVSGAPSHPKIVHFSGYDWEARQKYSNRGGKVNPYDAGNITVDQDGLLHLKITKRGDQWICAEVKLQQSLGHGLYRFKVHDVSNMDTAAVLTMYTWGTNERFNREMDVEVSSFGDPVADNNAQFVVQPYYQASNVSHFHIPPGAATFSFRWQPGAVLFSSDTASHHFKSGVPDPGGEFVHINLYAFGKARVPMKDPTEVVIESFTYSP